MINVDIAELETRDGRFQAKCREVELTEISRDPEYDACHALTLAGVPDAPVTFWRDRVQTLTHSSFYEMGKRRIALGQEFPRVRPKRGTWPGSFESEGGMIAGGDLENSGT